MEYDPFALFNPYAVQPLFPVCLYRDDDCPEEAMVWVFALGEFKLFQIGVQASSLYLATQAMASGDPIQHLGILFGSDLADRLRYETFEHIGSMTLEGAEDAFFDHSGE